jgi:hypothetical protein
MSKIHSLDIDTSNMPNAITIRKLTVFGEIGASFTIIALQVDSQKYYNFLIGEFENGHSPNSNLVVTLSKAKYHNSITFPGGAGEYVVKLIPSNGTTVRNGNTSRSITKKPTGVISFSPTSNNALNYMDLPEIISAANVNQTSNLFFDWDILNSSNDGYGYGLRLIHDVDHKQNWYFTKSAVVESNPEGSGNLSRSVQVSNTEDLGVGTQLYYYDDILTEPGSLTYITRINTETNIITFSSEIPFVAGETMVFRAYGSRAISAAIDVSIEFAFPKRPVTPTLLTQVVRTSSDSPSTTITIKDTHGIAGGSLIEYKGFGVLNSGSNKVVSVTEDIGGDDGDGSILVGLAQSLKEGTVLTFDGVHKTINISGFLTVNKHPDINRNIYLDLDKIIIVGEAS